MAWRPFWTNGRTTMLFYKIEFESEKALESGDRQSRRVRSRLKALTADANARTKGTIAFFVSDFEDRRVSIGAALFVDAVLMNRRDLAEAFEEFRAQTRLKGKILDTREITAGDFSRMLNLADRNDYIDDDDNYKTDLGMAFISACTESECEEVLLDAPCTKSEAIAEAKRPLPILGGGVARPGVRATTSRRTPATRDPRPPTPPGTAPTWPASSPPYRWLLFMSAWPG